jgi:hypothetical protein
VKGVIIITSCSFIIMGITAMYVKYRVRYSKNVCHAIHFKTKLLRMAKEDSMWLYVHNRLPDEHVMAKKAMFGSMHDSLTSDEKDKYYLYNAKHVETKGKRNVDLNI